jgi:sugar phosphate permease
MLSWSSKFLVSAHRMDLGDVGPYLIVPPLLFDAGSILIGHFASVRARYRPRGAPDRALFILSTLFFFAFALVPFGETPLQSMIFGGLGMAGGGGVYALATSDMLGRVPPNVVGSAAGTTAAAQSIAHIVSALILGMLIQVSGGYIVPFLVVGLWGIPGCIGWLVWRPPPLHGDADASAAGAAQ